MKDFTSTSIYNRMKLVQQIALKAIDFSWPKGRFSRQDIKEQVIIYKYKNRTGRRKKNIFKTTSPLKDAFKMFKQHE